MSWIIEKKEKKVNGKGIFIELHTFYNTIFGGGFYRRRLGSHKLIRFIPMTTGTFT